MKEFHDIVYSDIGHPRQKLDLYLPDCPDFPVFVYFHGGGLENGSKDNETFMSYLTDRGIAVVCANYRMYPSAVFPEFVRDAAAAVAWTFKNIHNYGNCSKIYVGGSSAGGYLSMMLCYNKAYLAPYKINPAQLAGFIHDAGQPTTHFNVLRERGLDSRRLIVDEAAPLYYIGLEPEYAPQLFLISDHDIPGRYEQTMLTLATLKDFGYDQTKIDWKLLNGTHCHYCRQFDENGDSVLGKLIYEYIKTREG